MVSLGKRGGGDGDDRMVSTFNFLTQTVKIIALYHRMQKSLEILEKKSILLFKCDQIGFFQQ